LITYYDPPGGREAMVRLGPEGGPVAIFVLPPFEEANRTRTFAVTIMRALAERGVASALPDLPGTGESLVATEDATLEAWRTAFAAAANAVGAVIGVAIRGGVLIDTDAVLAGRWHLAPQLGSALVRELDRVREAGGGGGDESVVEIAGNRISRHLLGEVGAAAASTERTRVVRLDSDAQPADRKVAGAPLWRRAEPNNDPAMAALLADDIAEWVRTCGS
jgi:hypothetical protein